MDLRNKDCFCIGYNTYVIEKAQVCGKCIFSIAMYNFCKLKKKPSNNGDNSQSTCWSNR